jgi:hypothetical protein
MSLPNGPAEKDRNCFVTLESGLKLEAQLNFGTLSPSTILKASYLSVAVIKDAISNVWHSADK